MSELVDLYAAEDAAFERARARRRQMINDLLEIVAAQAPTLRKAGVTTIDVEEFAATLAPPEVEVPPAPRALEGGAEASDSDDDGDPLYDPMTFGSLKVPGAARRAGKSTNEE